MDPTTRHALRVNWLNLALGHRTFEADGATFVVERDHPSIYDANFVYDVAASSPAEVDRLLARMRQEYAHCEKLTFRFDPGMAPSLEARLALEGAERNRTLVMLLDRELRGGEAPHEIRLLEDEAGWQALVELKRTDRLEHAPKLNMDPAVTEIPDALAAIARKKSPPVQYFLAWVEGQPVGSCHAWEGVDGIGQVEDLFVMTDFRRRGIASALIRRCVVHARSCGAGPLVLCADPGDSPKAIYAAMGWRPIAVTRQYCLDVLQPS